MSETWQEILFAFLAVTMSGAAVMVVTTRNVIHAALYLVATLAGAGALYILLLAEFVAWVQILVYVGAVVVLMLFGLMLTRAPIGKGKFDNDQRLIAAICAGAIFFIVSSVLVNAFQGQSIDLARESGTVTRSVGEVIFSVYVLPFEAVSVLLLAALIGAIVVARKDTDAG
ncbi:MAG TPA: NADH-quinone oxidoreductase subunit J [Actinomycetota bacterium]|nr:NADH-quinone oxidoreductase subunit J [Actinomycetota bacterium]